MRREEVVIVQYGFTVSSRGMSSQASEPEGKVPADRVRVSAAVSFAETLKWMRCNIGRFPGCVRKGCADVEHFNAGKEKGSF